MCLLAFQAHCRKWSLSVSECPNVGISASALPFPGRCECSSFHWLEHFRSTPSFLYRLCSAKELPWSFITVTNNRFVRSYVWLSRYVPFVKAAVGEVEKIDEVVEVSKAMWKTMFSSSDNAKQFSSFFRFIRYHRPAVVQCLVRRTSRPIAMHGIALISLFGFFVLANAAMVPNEEEQGKKFESWQSRRVHSST